jgi:[glutamine synthetase] adenylyltransferase / [glutamine synthetase]-adenylyl-L-tyrosine phosphorylase
MGTDLHQRAREHSLRQGSRTLAELLDRDESARALLESDAPLPDAAGYLAAIRAAASGGEAGGTRGLRLEKRRRLLEIAARDLNGETSVETATRALSDLAEACLEIALELVAAPPELAIVAMGKLGGRELNYVSDIDVMFVTSGDARDATKAAERLLSELGEFAPEGRAYIIDANLRPEGRSGALVRSLGGYMDYYEKWAKAWEFQALIKARPAAGNKTIAEELVRRTRGFVFPEQITADHIASIRHMKARVEDHAVRSARKSRSSENEDVKLGPGGIRDIEFSIQLLQLVHGAADETVRDGSSLTALHALVRGGYVDEEDGAGLDVAYRWLRKVEHRLQIWQERRTHALPKDEEARAKLARLMGFADTPVHSAYQRFEAGHRSVLADVRHRFDRLFYRPMIESLADGGGTRLSGEAIRDRLRILGFRDVDRAARNLERLVTGTSRRAKLVRLLTPALLRWLAIAPVPDEGLLAFARLTEALDGRVDALGALRDNPPGLAFLAKVLGSGRLLGEVLVHVPEEISVIADPENLGPPKDRDRLVREAGASLQWRDPAARWDGLRRFKRREMLNVALLDLANRSDVGQVGASLADLADASLEATLEDVGFPFAVVGMGKLGGRELNYSSDVDVMFVHDASQPEAEKVAEQLLRAVGEVTPEGQAFKVDAALRPEGRSGPLARSFDSYIEYYERWAQPWEHQALIKARWVAGDKSLAERLLEVTREHAFPEVLPAAALAEMRHLKARMEKERIPRGTDPRRHLKMGPGGLSDIEFAVQLIQRREAAGHPALQVAGTLEALVVAFEAGFIEEEDQRVLESAYRFLMKLRNRAFLLLGRPTDSLSTKTSELEALGIAMGFEDQPRQELEETYRRHTRRARRVAESFIYD